MIMKKIWYILAVIAFTLSSGVNAQKGIFKCVNKEGATYYNDKPCPKQDEQTKFKAVKDPVNGYIPDVSKDTQLARSEVIAGGSKVIKVEATDVTSEVSNERASSEGGEVDIQSASNQPTESSSSQQGGDQNEQAVEQDDVVSYTHVADENVNVFEFEPFE